MRGSAAQLLMLAVLPMLKACGDGSGAPMAEPLIVEDSHLQVLDTAARLTDVRDVMSTDDGSIWVLDAMEPFVHIYGAEGEHQLATGRKGRGMGEMLFPTFLLNVDGGVEVWDRGTQRRLLISSDGTIVDRGRIDRGLLFHARSDILQVTYGAPFRSRVMAGSVITTVYPKGLLTDVDYRSGQIVRVQDDQLQVLLQFEDVLDAGVSGDEAARHLVGIPLWDACPDGSLRVFDPDYGRLFHLDSSGRVRDTLDLAVSTEPLRTEHIRRYLRGMVVQELGSGAVGDPDVEREVETLVRSHRREFGTKLPGGVDLRCDVSGRTWIAEFDNSVHSLGFGANWLVVDGNTSQRVRFPEGFRPFEIGPRRAIGIFTDSLDVQWLASALLPI